MKTPATHENQFNALRSSAIKLLENFITDLAEKPSFAESLKVTENDISEWEALLEDSKRHSAHLAIIPLNVHLMVMARILCGEGYAKAITEERQKYSGHEFVCVPEKKKTWRIL